MEAHFTEGRFIAVQGGDPQCAAEPFYLKGLDPPLFIVPAQPPTARSVQSYGPHKRFPLANLGWQCDVPSWPDWIERHRDSRIQGELSPDFLRIATGIWGRWVEREGMHVGHEVSPGAWFGTRPLLVPL